MKSKPKFNVGRKIKSKKTGRPPVIRNKYQVLIWQLIIDPNNFSQADWSRETKAAKAAWEMYPNLNFWEQLDLGFYLNSLNFLTSKDGKKHLSQKFLDFKVASSVQTKEVVAENFDESKQFDKEIKTKSFPQKLNAFFKNGKKTK
tara:strand:- start:97 stop:531 length:435 start_codon:yes stop_codon:yes gene_type:complete